MNEANPEIREIRRLFEELVDLAPEQQQERLRQAEALSPSLAAAVRKLLAADDAAGSFLRGATTTPDHLKQIGPYKLLKLIGEGGFGAVYMAEQIEPVRRRVALKIVKPGMDTRQVIARFEAERQALAIMEHPNIARVFEAGTSEEGRPYFVMELVTGVPITQFCDENSFTVRQRMELLITVCRAVHHAHQKGIIHRDIKPSNVLVTLHDGAAVPKVIDFGIAKALDQPLTEKTLFTEFRTMIGTPEYMSPEQAEISRLDIDTRSDVYSLGVLMYELLAGVTPFDGKELRSKAYGEMQRIIREVDPPAPSVRLSTAAKALVIAQSRQHSSADRLSGDIRGELDWIAMRCMEKDRTRRYDSAAALANDLGNYLTGEAVLASPPSRLYLLRKSMRRNKAVFTTVLLVVLSLAIGLVASLLALREASIQKRLAEQHAVDAQREAKRAKTVSDFLEETIASADPYTDDNNPRISQVFDRAVEKIDAGSLGSDPQTEATIRSVIGRVSKRIDKPRQSAEQLEKAIKLRRAETPPNTAEIAKLLTILGSAKSNLAEYQAADALYEEARQLATASDQQDLLANIRFNQATSWMSRRQYDRAEAPLSELVASQAQDEDQRALHMEALATVEIHLMNPAHAEELARKALEVRRRTAGKSVNRAVFESIGTLAKALGAQGKDKEAVVLLEEAIKEFTQTDRPGMGTLAMLREVLARAYTRTGRAAEALGMYKQVLDARLQFDGPVHPRVATVRLAYGTELLRSGKRAEAKEQFTLAWNIIKDRTDIAPLTKSEIASLLATVSTEKDSPKSSELFEIALTGLRAEPSARRNCANTLLNYWLLCFQGGDFDKSLKLAEELRAIAPTVYRPGSYELSQAKIVYVRSILKTGGDVAGVEALAREVVQIREALKPEIPLATANAKSVLGELLLALGKMEEATALIEDSTRLVESSPEAPQMVVRECHERLAKLRTAQGN